jgi:peptidyl-prolyl cis-trans isomerase SurA
MKLYLFLILIALSAHSKLLDKIAGVINEKVITLSEIERVIETIEFRKKVAPLIYSNSEKYNDVSILKLLQNNFIVRDKLSEMGYVISDDSVESRIAETERARGLRRQDLINFLESNNMTFTEYFELIRQGMEYSIFYSRIISPLVNITDQEVKNKYYESQSKKKTLSFIFDLTDFTFNRVLTKQELEEIPNLLDEYIKTGNISSKYSDFESNKLGKLKVDDLPKELGNILRNTNEGSFSQAYIKDGVTHIFYVSKKDIAESNDYLKNKERIYNELFIRKSVSIIDNWFSRESLNFYILNNL